MFNPYSCKGIKFDVKSIFTVIFYGKVATAEFKRGRYSILNNEHSGRPETPTWGNNSRNPQCSSEWSLIEDMRPSRDRKYKILANVE